MTNRIFRKAGLYFVGSISTKLMGVALIPIYAFSVGSADLGRYDYLLALGQIAAPLFYVAIWEAALRFLITGSHTDGRRSTENTSTIVFFALVMSAVIGVAGAITVSVGLMPLVDGMILAAVTMLTGLVQVWQFICRAQGETRRFVSSGVGSGVVGFALVLIFVVLLKAEFAGLVASYVGAQIFALLWIEVRLRLLRDVRLTTTSVRALRTLLRYSTPLFINLVALGLIAGFGKVLLVHVAGNAESGVYSFAMKFATIVVTLGTILSMSIIEEGMLRASSPHIAEFYTQVINGIASVVMIFVSVLTPATYVLFAVAFRSTEYASAQSLIPMLMLYAGFSVVGTQVGSVFMTVGRTSFLGVSTLLGAAITVVSSLLLIGPFGAHGVATALALGSLCTLLARVLTSRTHIEYAWRWKRSAVMLTCYVLIAAGAEALSRGSAVWLSAYAAVIAGAGAWPFYLSLRAVKEVSDEEPSVAISPG